MHLNPFTGRRSRHDGPGIDRIRRRQDECGAAGARQETIRDELLNVRRGHAELELRIDDHRTAGREGAPGVELEALRAGAAVGAGSE
jgi:hypothetical protein